jgi:hypothetical protein
MGYIMTAQKFAEKSIHIANNVNTTYAKGMFGTPITQASVDAKSKQMDLLLGMVQINQESFHL